MLMYSYSEAKQHLAALLERAYENGEVCIKRKNGQVFVIKPVIEESSPLDVEGLNIPISAAQIVNIIHEGRKSL